MVLHRWTMTNSLIWISLAVTTALVRADQVTVTTTAADISTSEQPPPSQETSFTGHADVVDNDIEDQVNEALDITEDQILHYAPSIWFPKPKPNKDTSIISSRISYEMPPPPPNRIIPYKSIPTIIIPWKGIEPDVLESQIAVSGVHKYCKKCIIAGINETHLVVQEDNIGYAPPIQQNKNCKYSLEEVEKIAQVLKDINEDKDSSVAFSDTFAASNNSLKSECTQVLQDIKKNSEGLRSLLKNLKKGQSGYSDEDFLKMQIYYKAKIDELKSEIDYVRMGVNQEAQLKIQKVLDEQHRLTRNFDELLEKYERQARELEASNLVWLTYALRDGDFVQALKSFEHIKNKSSIPEVVQKMFTIEKFENVLIFVATIPNSHMEIKRIIIDMVTKHVETASNDNYLILWAYRKCFPKNEETKKSSITFIFKTHLQTSSIEARWKFATHEKDHDHILRFAQERPGVLDKMWLDLLSYKIYAPRDMTSVLKFANKLSPSQATTFRYYLYKQGIQMKATFSLKPALQIAYHEYQHLKKYGKSDLWNQVERAVALIASGEPACIAQTEAQRVLYAADSYDGDRQKVYARPVFKRPPQETSSMWRFVPIDSDSMTVFKIKSASSERPLYAAYYGYNYSGNRRRLFTWGKIKEDNCDDKWELNDADDKRSREAFQILNKCWNEALHVEMNSESDDPQLGTKAYTIKSGNPPLWSAWNRESCKY